MNVNNYEEIKSFLDELNQYNQVVDKETSIFCIGSRGYYENPTTDILAFFLDDNESHGLGALVIEALVAILPDEYKKIDCSLVSPPEREIRTKTGKRIDLLLENQQWIMVIENKIFHEQNNPFKDYENHVSKKNASDNKKSIFIILSPSGSVSQKNPKWIGISYATLINSIKDKLSGYFISEPLNKWVILLREFILHLENIMNKPEVSDENINFILSNLAKIKQAQKMQDKVLKAYKDQLHNALSVKLNAELYSVIVHWHGYPAIRFALKGWPTDSDVVLFLDSRKGKSFCINYYSSVVNDTQRKVADEHFKEEDCTDIWNELKGTYRCYKAHFTEEELENFNQDVALKKLAHKLELMDEFEKKIRLGLAI